MKKTCSVLMCIASLAACQSEDAVESRVDSLQKFPTLPALLADPSVKAAIAKLPAGDGVAAGAYYQGDTPADIDGEWSTDCCGGRQGRWPRGNFGGSITFEMVGPGRVDVPSFDSGTDREDGIGSFITGTGNHVTTFLQLAITCKQDGERVRAVAVDRFIVEPTRLSNYVRSYVVLERDRPNPPWKCFGDKPGSGALSTPATFAMATP